MNHRDVINGYNEMRRFYSSRYCPKDREHIMFNGDELVAHLKDGHENCERCFFHTINGCSQDSIQLDCFDLRNDKRYYFTKEEKNGKETYGTEEEKGV